MDTNSSRPIQGATKNRCPWHKGGQRFFCVLIFQLERVAIFSKEADSFVRSEEKSFPKSNIYAKNRNTLNRREVVKIWFEIFDKEGEAAMRV
ncbi:MAG: hypothetical protein AAGU75_07200 [Bacillota bacterium]